MPRTGHEAVTHAGRRLPFQRVRIAVAFTLLGALFACGALLWAQVRKASLNARGAVMAQRVTKVHYDRKALRHAAELFEASEGRVPTMEELAEVLTRGMVKDGVDSRLLPHVRCVSGLTSVDDQDYEAPRPESE